LRAISLNGETTAEVHVRSLGAGVETTGGEHRLRCVDHVGDQALVDHERAFVLGEVAALVPLAKTRQTAGFKPSVCGNVWNTRYPLSAR
jgi:hypothetical protein